jgi:hypothetical protein
MGCNEHDDVLTSWYDDMIIITLQVFPNTCFLMLTGQSRYLGGSGNLLWGDHPPREGSPRAAFRRTPIGGGPTLDFLVFGRCLGRLFSQLKRACAGRQHRRHGPRRARSRHARGVPVVADRGRTRSGAAAWWEDGVRLAGGHRRRRCSTGPRARSLVHPRWWRCESGERAAVVPTCFRTPGGDGVGFVRGAPPWPACLESQSTREGATCHARSVNPWRQTSP